MEPKQDFDDKFMSRHMPPCLPSTTGSFSAPSSVYDAFTPTSGLSTPRRSIDIDSSMHMDINMNMALPSPSPYYAPAGPNAALMAAENYSHNTPTRKHRGITLAAAMGLDYHDSMIDIQSLQNYNGPPTSQGFDRMTSMSSQLMAASSFVEHAMAVIMNDMYPIFPYQFGKPLSHRSSPTSSPMALGPGSPESQHNAMDMQEGSSTYRSRTMGNTTGDKMAEYERIPKTKEDKLRGCQKVPYMPIDQVTTVESPKYQCTEPDCPKTYSRKEHLKRHLQSKHGIGAVWACEFCEEKREKPFNRFDNYKAHVKVHADPSRDGHGRVQYVPAAVPRFKELLENTKQRRPKPKRPEETSFGSQSSATAAISAKKMPVKREPFTSRAGTPASSFDRSRFSGSRNSSLEPPMPFQMWTEYNIKVEPN